MMRLFLVLCSRLQTKVPRYYRLILLIFSTIINLMKPKLSAKRVDEVFRSPLHLLVCIQGPRCLTPAASPSGRIMLYRQTSL